MRRETDLKESLMHQNLFRVFLSQDEIQVVVATLQSQRLKKNSKHRVPGGDMIAVFGDFGSSSRTVFREKRIQ
jgi:hypothetical protein